MSIKTYGPTNPATTAAAVTPSDTTGITLCRAVMIAVAGDIKVDTADGDTVTLTVPAGLLPLMVSKVYATGTTATGITALY